MLVLSLAQGLLDVQKLDSDDQELINLFDSVLIFRNHLFQERNDTSFISRFKVGVYENDTRRLSLISNMREFRFECLEFLECEITWTGRRFEKMHDWV